MFVALTGEL
jgi:hypothetical protein